MPSQKSSFSIYIDPKTSSKPENSHLSTPQIHLSKKPRIQVEIQSSITNWLRKPLREVAPNVTRPTSPLREVAPPLREVAPPLREVAPNFARPTDPAYTLSRLPDRKVTLGSLKKWQKRQPNDHTSKLSLYLFIFFVF